MSKKFALMLGLLLVASIIVTACGSSPVSMGKNPCPYKEISQIDIDENYNEGIQFKVGDQTFFYEGDFEDYFYFSRSMDKEFPNPPITLRRGESFVIHQPNEVCNIVGISVKPPNNIVVWRARVEP